MKIPKSLKRTITKTVIKNPSLRRMVARRVARKVLRPIPLIGTGAVVALALGTLRRKGAMRGSADVALDLIPVVGLAKSVIEAFRGDFIPDKKAS